MLVKAYQHRWFIDCIIKYLERVLGETNLKYENNSKLFNKLFNYLTHNLDEHSRKSELSKLETFILTSESIAEKTKQINSLNEGPTASKNRMNKERRLVNDVFEEKAIEWVKMQDPKYKQ